MVIFFISNFCMTITPINYKKNSDIEKSKFFKKTELKENDDILNLFIIFKKNYQSNNIIELEKTADEIAQITDNLNEYSNDFLIFFIKEDYCSIFLDILTNPQEYNIYRNIMYILSDIFSISRMTHESEIPNCFISAGITDALISIQNLENFVINVEHIQLLAEISYFDSYKRDQIMTIFHQNSLENLLLNYPDKKIRNAISYLIMRFTNFSFSTNQNEHSNFDNFPEWLLNFFCSHFSSLSMKSQTRFVTALSNLLYHNELFDDIKFSTLMKNYDIIHVFENIFSNIILNLNNYNENKKSSKTQKSDQLIYRILKVLKELNEVWEDVNFDMLLKISENFAYFEKSASKALKLMKRIINGLKNADFFKDKEKIMFLLQIFNESSFSTKSHIMDIIYSIIYYLNHYEIFESFEIILECMIDNLFETTDTKLFSLLIWIIELIVQLGARSNSQNEFTNVMEKTNCINFLENVLLDEIGKNCQSSIGLILEQFNSPSD